MSKRLIDSGEEMKERDEYFRRKELAIQERRLHREQLDY